MIGRGGNTKKLFQLLKMTVLGHKGDLGVICVPRSREVTWSQNFHPNDSLVTSLNNIAQSELSGLALWNMRNEIEKNQEISEKPFPCDFCDSRFKRLYDKNRHMKMAHLAHLEQTDQG